MAHSTPETWCVSIFQVLLCLNYISAATTSYPVSSAVRLYNQWFVTSSKAKKSVPKDNEELEIHISPMHVRLDFGIIMQDDGLLSFFEDLLTLQTQHAGQDLVSSETTIDQYLPSQRNKQQRTKPTEHVFYEDPDTADISQKDLEPNPVSYLRIFLRCSLK